MKLTANGDSKTQKTFSVPMCCQLHWNLRREEPGSGLLPRRCRDDLIHLRDHRFQSLGLLGAEVFELGGIIGQMVKAVQ